MKNNTRKWNKKVTLYAVDFVVNIIVVVLVTMYYRNLYFTVPPSDFVHKVILAGSGIPMIAAMVSILCAIIELIYGIRRMKDTEVMTTIMQWPIMWAIFKGLLLVAWIITNLLGIDLSSFF